VEAYLSFFAGIHGPHGGITMPDSVRSALMTFIGILALFGGLEHAAAQSATPLSAENSDPRKMGWMTGLPPPLEKLIMQPESDFFSFPKLRWTVCHIRELIPTKQVNRGIGPPVPLDYAINDVIDAVTFTPMGGG